MRFPREYFVSHFRKDSVLISLIPWWTARCLHGSPGGLAPVRAYRCLQCALVLCFYLSVPLPLQRTYFPMQQRHPAGLLGRSKIRASTVSSPLFWLQCCGSLSPSAPLIFGTYFVWVLANFLNSRHNDILKTIFVSSSFLWKRCLTLDDNIYFNLYNLHGVKNFLLILQKAHSRSFERSPHSCLQGTHQHNNNVSALFFPVLWGWRKILQV